MCFTFENFATSSTAVLIKKDLRLSKCRKLGRTANAKNIKHRNVVDCQILITHMFVSYLLLSFFFLLNHLIRFVIFFFLPRIPFIYSKREKKKKKPTETGNTYETGQTHAVSKRSCWFYFTTSHLYIFHPLQRLQHSRNETKRNTINNVLWQRGILNTEHGRQTVSYTLLKNKTKKKDYRL